MTFRDGAATICTTALSGNTATCSPALAAGSHSITAEYSGTSTGTPTFSGSTSAALAQTITTRAVTVKANDVTRTYGDSTPAFSITLASGTLASGDTLAALGTPTYGFDNVGDGITVGTYRINVSGLANSNYAITYSSGTNRGLLTITTRAVTVKANDVTRTYGDSTPAFSITLASGTLASGDTLAALGTPTYGFDNVGDGITVGTYRINVPAWPTRTMRSPIRAAPTVGC